jgi:hypothetical protein
MRPVALAPHDSLIHSPEAAIEDVRADTDERYVAGAPGAHALLRPCHFCN